MPQVPGQLVKSVEDVQSVPIHVVGSGVPKHAAMVGRAVGAAVGTPVGAKQ